MFQRISLFLLLITFSSQFTNAQIIYPSDTLHAKPYPSGDQHIIPQPFGGFNIGDVNGDGRDDYATTYRTNRPETDYLGDTKYVTAITFSEPKPEPDLILDYYLSPVGDMNNDGFADFYTYHYDYDTQTNEYVIREMLAFNDQTTTLIGSDTLHIDSKTRYVIKSINSDLDLDGYNDLVFYRGGSYGELIIYFGGVNIGEVRSLQANIPFRGIQSSSSLGSLLVGDVDNDSRPEIIRIGMNNFDPYSGLSDNLNTYIAVFEINEQRELFRQDSSKVDITSCTEYLEPDCWGFAPSSIGAYLIDTNDDNLQEIVIIGSYSGGSNYKMIYASYDSLQQGFLTADWILNAPSESKPLPYVSYLIPLNDFNGDGTPDFLARSSYTFSEDVNKIAHFDGQIISFPEDSITGSFSLYNMGDFNNDGFDDFTTSYYTGTTGGYKIFFGNENASLSDTLQVEYSDYYNNSTSANKYILNLTDIDNDGIDDIGIVKEGDYYFDVPEQLEIYRSSTNDIEHLTPSIIIKNDDFYSVFYPAIGDFNNDGNVDIAINHSNGEYSWHNSGAGIYFYFGDGSTIDTTSGHQILSNSLYEDSDNKGFSYIKNVGDINRDGIDDLAFSTGSIMRDLETNQYIGQTYVLFGGEELSDTQNLIIPVKGQDFERIEDLNGDGFNEFAISDALFNNHNQRSAGRVFIFNSFDENGNEQFDYTPLLEIPSPDSSAYYMGQFGINISSGDFNGDGFSDLVVKAGYISSNSNEEELVYIFEGGSTPDSLVDEKITVTYEHLQNNIFLSRDYGSDVVKSNLGIVAGIPDFNNDGKDELLIETGFLLSYSTNATLYLGDNTGNLHQQDPLTLYAPNQFSRMGFGRNTTVRDETNYEIALGDFTGSGNKTDLLFFQNKTYEFLTDPVIRYSLSGITVSNQRENEVATHFELSQNYPNPFNPSTTISYSLAGTSDVLMEVYNILGQKVATLVQEKQTAGSYRVTFNARNLSSGVYFYQLTTNQFTASKKMLLIK